MKLTVELEREDLDAMYDVIFDVKNYEPTDTEIKEIWNLLPNDIKGVAIQWGCDDTVFRDKMYKWLENN